MNPTRLLLTPSWFSALARVDRAQLGLVYSAAADWVRFIESANPHPVHGYVSLAVNDEMRALAVRRGDTLVLFHVDHHDPCYLWAERHAIDPDTVDEIVVRIREERAPAEAEPATPGGPLERVSGKSLEKLGVPHRLAGLLRGADEDGALEIAKLLPAHTSEAILDLLADEPVAVAQRRYERAQAATALDELDERSLGIVIAGGHPVSEGQRRAVVAKSRGAMKVTGGPGTGKTVVAVHRAHYLASALFGSDPRRVLLTCPFASFAGPLRRMIDARCEGEPGVAARIDVLGIGAVADQLLARAGRPRRLATEAERAECWAAAIARVPDAGSREAYEAERAQVLDRHDAWTWEAYRDAERIGRVVALDAKGREVAWAVTSAFEDQLEARGLVDPIARARHARRLVDSGDVPSPWAAVVCDEVQDAAPGELRLLAALARELGDRQVRANGLFLVGDGWQRVYGRPVPLAQCGIDVSGGRSKVLRVNYRTNEGIRQAAIRAVDGLEPDPIDGSEDESGHEGYRSLRPGFPPIQMTFASADEELDYIVRAYLDGKAGTFVLTRTEAYRDAVVAGLVARGLAPDVLAPDGEPEPAGLTVATFHRAKGLETPRVVIAGAHQSPQPYRGADRGEQAWHEANERRLLYGAMQRARDWLAVCRVAP